MVTVVPDIPQPRKRHVPTGGVHRPIHKFMMIMMPKCNGCKPSFSTIGKKIGVNIRMAGVISINVPTTNRMALIIKRRRILLLVVLIKLALIF